MTTTVRDRITTTASGAKTLARRIGTRLYDELARLNYDRELVTRRNRTPAGAFRCYEPLNRHGDDAMLAELATHCRSDDVVYDIGANVGIYALALATTTTTTSANANASASASDHPDRRVLAFEPSPRIVDRLRTNLRANAVGDQVDVYDCGIGDETGDRPFYVSTYPELSGFDRTSATRWGATVDNVITVSISRLDDLADELPPPDVIKIDVEGGAPAVVRGARETLDRHGPTLFVEIHEAGFDGDIAGETREAVDDCGYDVAQRDGYLRCEPRRS